MANHLCAICTIVFARMDLPELGGEDFETVLFESSSYIPEDGINEGCAFCLLLYSTLSEDQRTLMRQRCIENRSLAEEDPRVYLTRFSLNSFSESGPSIVMLQEVRGRVGTLYDRNETSESRMATIVQVLPTEKFRAVDIQPSMSMTISEESWQLARLWIKNCEDNHAKCRRLVPTFKAPTRLIDVGYSNTIDLRLCEDVPAGTVYATLSHCWGGHQPFRLLQSNHAHLKRSIEYDALPKTFQDAIVVARQIDVQYIWIDSICIIQDSKEDWVKESQLMHKVYSNAICNIAATAARDGRAGLFLERDPRLLKPCQIAIDWNASYRGSYVLVNTNTWRIFVRDCPLFERAWVYQERLLSRRNLLFGHSQIFWECRQDIASECFPTGFPDNSKSWYGYQFKGLSLEDGANIRRARHYPDISALNAFSLWNEIVGAYSSGKLTFGSDKLVAISALARHVQSLLGEETEYLAGLWRPWLASQLLWTTFENTLTSRQKDSGAPTWSWASVNGMINDPCVVNDCNEKDILIEIHAAEVKLASEDKFGPVATGFVSISGRLARVSISTVSDIPKYQDYPSYQLKTNTGSIATSQDISIDSNIQDAPPSQRVYENLHLLPVREVKYPSGNVVHNCLILEILEEPGCVFQRVGACTFYLKDDGPLFERAFEDFDIQAGREFNSTDTTSGSQTYRITIV